MQATDHNFAATQPLPQLANIEADAADVGDLRKRRRFYRSLYEQPRTLWETLFRTTRIASAFAFVMPTVCGAVLAWWEWGQFDLSAFLFTLIGALTVMFGLNALGEYRDYKFAVACGDVKMNGIAPATGYGLMANEQIQPPVVLNLGHILVLISFICCLWLVLLAGWPVLFFCGLSFLLMYTYANPPVHYAHRGWGLGELGVFVGYGLLQLWNGYFIQSKTISWLPLWVSIPFALLSLLVHFNYNIIHHRRDWLMRKRTLVVSLGVLRALDVSAILVVLAYVAILATVSLAHLPLLALITLGALPVALGAFGRMDREQPSLEECFWLYSATVQAALWTGVLFCAALLVDKLY